MQATQKKALKGLLLDFNGTLFFDSTFHIEAFKIYFKERGKPEPSVDYITRSIFGRNNQRIYADNFDPDATREEWMAFADRKEGLYRESCLAHPELMKYTDGVVEMLDYLKANSIPYCLATGSGLDNISFYIEHMGLGRWFDESNMVYSDGSFAGKPEPDTYLLAAKKIGLSADECIVFEDGTSGLLSARRANAGAVIALYEEGMPDPITKEASADAVCHDLRDWKSILENFGLLR